MTEETKHEGTVESLTEEIKALLKDISVIKDTTQRNDEQCVEINFFENPLNPNLLAYCFDVILGLMLDIEFLRKSITLSILIIKVHLLQ